MGNSLGYFTNPSLLWKPHHLSRPLPTEVQLDVFLCLTRFDLDGVQFSSPQMRDFLDAHAVRLPLRDIASAAVAGWAAHESSLLEGPIVKATNGFQRRFARGISTKEKLCLVMIAIQGAFVGELTIGTLVGCELLNINEGDVAVVVALAHNVYVSELFIGCSSGLNQYPSTSLTEIITAFPRIEFVWCDSVHSSRIYADISDRSLTRGLPFPGLETYGCNFPAVNTGIHGYCISDQPYIGPLNEPRTSKHHLLASDLASKVHQFECVASAFYRVKDVPIKQQGLEEYAANRMPSSTDDHLSYFFDGIVEVDNEDEDDDAEFHELRFVAQICLHDGCLTFRFTSDPSRIDTFLVCEGK